MSRYARMQGKDEPGKDTNNPPTLPVAEEPEKQDTSGVTTPIHHDTVTPQRHEISSGDMVSMIRAAVIQTGQASTNHRLTNVEKERIEDVVWEFKKNGIRTTENEIVRIALNYILNHHDQEGKNSLLAITLNLLHR